LISLDGHPRPLDHLTALGTPNDPALITRDVTLDYAALELGVGRMARQLRVAVPPGGRVASWLNKTIEACILPLAAARAGLIHVPINPILRRAQVAHILSDSGATLLITTKARSDTLEVGDCPSDCRIWDDDLARLWKEGDPIGISNLATDILAAILYTSGSTGLPKGVMLSHANLWLGAVSVGGYLKLSRSDRTLCVLPLAFDYGQNQLFSTWAAGGAACPIDYLVAREVIRAVERFQITTIAGVPPLWHQLTDVNWSNGAATSLKRITNSGGALTGALIERLRACFPSADIYSMYGLTEAFRSTYLDPALLASHPTSIGKAIPLAEILVVGPDGQPSTQGEPGELVHCGPLVAKGYWNDVERTEKRFRPAPSQSTFGGMAVWSGDTVRRDAEGLLYFVGRNDEMIKVSGNRVSPQEVEAAAIASGAAVQVMAIGVPDERKGQMIVLVGEGDGSSESILRAYINETLPSYMQPSSILWEAKLPTNANGKLDRAAVRAMVLQ
jgi:acyl-CoA ligase (AMP-forming) (exosortase A-associated)